MNGMMKAGTAAAVVILMTACGDLSESATHYGAPAPAPAAAIPPAPHQTHEPSVVLIEEPADGMPARFTAVGDVNEDGRHDVLLGRSTIDPSGPSAVVSIYMENEMHELPATPNASFLLDPATADGVVADFDGDGHVDLAVAVYSDATGGRIEIHRGNGDGTFQAPVTVITGIDAMFLGTGDFNGDGNTDLAVSGSVEMRIYANEGNLSFGTPSVLPFPAYFTVGETDGDGRSELLVIEWMWDASVKVYGDLLGTPTVLATLPVPAGHVATSLSTSDMDGDGRQDVLVGSVESSTWAAGNARVFFNSANGLADWSDVATSAPVFKVASVDCDGDGRRDVTWYEEGMVNLIGFGIAQPDRTFTPSSWTVETDPVTVMRTGESIGCECGGVHCSSSTRSFKILGGTQ